MNREPVITVLGSINMDISIELERRPDKGETIKGSSYHHFSGGKGANQAIAMARLGAKVNFIGKIGDDEYGKILIEYLRNEKIDVKGIKVEPSMATGVAFITLADGDNSIIFIPGANHSVNGAYVEQHKHLLKESDLVVSQLEIPMAAVEKTATICKGYDIPFILNPAPAADLSSNLLEKVTYLTPNSIEEKSIKVQHVAGLENKLIVTAGKDGVYVVENGEKVRIPAYQIQPVDTTGAGDTFNGAFAYFIAKQHPLVEACHFANAAAALSTLKKGAQNGMPIKEELFQFIH
ncbi:ribokinase [Gracilibacillus dipsosauri]|uniref:Ribokinase n=1 Tax=Gracilibacillus dipsosauri TaxID=178340 RepID=A0A317KUL7_9BACI|nr:ribokinase [Gracilibacillus dipsosauri]PWU67222.1 ribokinase [Gracilibacillus dipsosauri]